jgi:Uma2 family endonuclease
MAIESRVGQAVTTLMEVSPPTLARAKRWSVAEFDRLGASGVLDDTRLELIEGQLIVMTPANPPHETAVGLVADALRAVVGPAYHVREEKTLGIDTWNAPLPDLAVVVGTRRAYATRRPTVAETILVVEVSDSTLATDRGDKADRYAASRLAEYWILNLVDRCLEIRRQPGRTRASRTGWRYADVTVLEAAATATLQLGEQEIAIAVVALLPMDG